MSTYFRCSTLVTTSYLNFPRVVPYSVSSDVVFQSVCITYLLFISHCRWLYRLCHHKKFKLCALIKCVLLKGLIGRKQQNNFLQQIVNYKNIIGLCTTILMILLFIFAVKCTEKYLKVSNSSCVGKIEK